MKMFWRIIRSANMVQCFFPSVPLRETLAFPYQDLRTQCNISPDSQYHLPSILLSLIKEVPENKYPVTTSYHYYFQNSPRPKIKWHVLKLTIPYECFVNSFEICLFILSNDHEVFFFVSTLFAVNASL